MLKKKTFGQNSPCFGQKNPSFVLKLLPNVFYLFTFESLRGSSYPLSILDFYLCNFFKSNQNNFLNQSNPCGVSTLKTDKIQMKKIVIFAMMMLPFIGICQQKENGKIYIEHPAINLVDAFTKAMVKGDTTAMSKMMTDDFKAQNVVTSSSFTEGTSKSAYLRNAMTWFNQLDYYSIKTIEGTYPDAFEYAKDPSDNKAVTVVAWDELKGVHKTTGVKANMYLHRSFQFTKDNKIRRLVNYINPEVANEIDRATTIRTNGIIYNQHDNINKLRLMMAAAEHGDWDKYYGFYDKDATFYDINDMETKPHNLESEKAGDKAIFDNFEIVSFEQTGYPDYMKYEIGGDTGTLYSWWNLHFRRKSDKKLIKVPMHYDMTVSKEGKIVNCISYYNAALLK